MKQKFLSILQSVPLEKYPRSSRVHRISSFDTSTAEVYVKREDEMGFAASGSKLRKYLSLIPYLQTKMPLEVAITGNPFSNHVLSLSSLLKEKKIPYTLFLEGHPPDPIGNYFFTSLITDPKNIVWNSSNSDDFRQEQERKLQKRFFWVPMGASMKESFPGSLTLALDVFRNEEDLHITFDHIFVDSGTGMMASSLILGLQCLARNSKVHVVQIGGKEEDFYKQLQECHHYLQDLLKEDIPLPSNYTMARPLKARSFGSLTSELVCFIQETARNEGIFLDPIYNGKLFYEGKKRVSIEEIKGKVLFIHSGGALSLSGFQGKFST